MHMLMLHAYLYIRGPANLRLAKSSKHKVTGAVQCWF